MNRFQRLTFSAILAATIAAPAMADEDSLLRFRGGIGVHPVAGIDATTGFPLRNDVMGVPPGGRPWVIESLQAKVTRDGRIKVRGEGLLLSATNNIGGIGGVTMVAATLFCDGGVAGGYSSSAAPLDANGDFEIKGALTGLPPSPCIKPVLLIRNVAGGVPTAWFAAGIVKD